ncbi:hypothetical protein NIES4101_26200 (plasmid) [Calothrix sp. NIES-4101]|nr:hypothetical protein NIES4101_26200 [Calothrix sp. NIES-4101]
MKSLFLPGLYGCEESFHPKAFRLYAAFGVTLAALTSTYIRSRIKLKKIYVYYLALISSVLDTARIKTVCE